MIYITVDYIVTHCCSSGTQEALGGKDLYVTDRETDYLEFIKNYANYKKWFFGHYHDNKNVSDKEILIYVTDYKNFIKLFKNKKRKSSFKVEYYTHSP